MNLKAIFCLSALLFVSLFALQVRADETPAPAFEFPSEEELENLRSSATSFQFQAEVSRMMNLIINSLYKNKEIFLRELISNASDALDKIRFLALTSPDALQANPELSIKIQADPDKNILHIIDTGIGMTKEDLIKNLGTIAKSGTADFLKTFEENADMNLIGQFGVGFYSVFLVADRVTVTSKHNGDKQYIWESTADSDFTIIEDPRGNTLGRGTVISLHLKPEASDYLNQNTLKNLIRKYSEFINFPIYLWTSKTETVEVPVEEEETEETPAEETTEDEAEVEDVEDKEDSEEEDKPKTKRVEQTTTQFELINESKPIWLRPASELTKGDYESFYRSFFKQTDDPLCYTHFKAEGEVEFKSLLFVPERAPSNLYSTEPINDIKLFVRRVFITDTEVEPLLPNYLRFIKGVLDSDDLPLNVSRETLQQSKLLKVIKKKLTKKALGMLKELADEDKEAFKKLYKEYSASLKLGVIEDHSNRKRLAKLLRFRSSESGEDLVTFDEYIDRFKKGQDEIYILAGATLSEIQASPFLERLTARGYEVLFLSDPIDEYAFQSMTDYEGHKFVNIAKDNLKLDDEDEDDYEEKYQPLTTWLKETLSAYVDKAVVSTRLTTSPCALVAPQFGWSGNMERIMQAQAYARQDDAMNGFYLKQKKTLEINPKHPIMEELLKRVENDQLDEETIEIARVLFDTAALRSGFSLREPVDFATRIERVVRRNLGVDLEKQVEVQEEKLPLAKDVEDQEDDEDEHDDEEEHVHDEL